MNIDIDLDVIVQMNALFETPEFELTCLQMAAADLDLDFAGLDIAALTPLLEGLGWTPEIVLPEFELSLNQFLTGIPSLGELDLHAIELAFPLVDFNAENVIGQLIDLLTSFGFGESDMAWVDLYFGLPESPFAEFLDIDFNIYHNIVMTFVNDFELDLAVDLSSFDFRDILNFDVQAFVDSFDFNLNAFPMMATLSIMQQIDSVCFAGLGFGDCGNPFAFVPDLDFDLRVPG